MVVVMVEVILLVVMIFVLVVVLMVIVDVVLVGVDVNVVMVVALWLFCCYCCDGLGFAVVVKGVVVTAVVVVLVMVVVKINGEGGDGSDVGDVSALVFKHNNLIKPIMTNINYYTFKFTKLLVFFSKKMICKYENLCEHVNLIICFCSLA